MIKQLLTPLGLLLLTATPAVTKEFSFVCQFQETHWEEAFGKKAAAHLTPKSEFVFTYAASDASNNDEVIAGTYRNLSPGFPVAKLVGVSNSYKTTLLESSGADNGFVVTIFRKEQDARGIPAVMNLHSMAYGLQQLVGFCH